MAPILRDATADDFGFAFGAKREALGPYIKERWGWSETEQLRFHEERWNGRPWKVIMLGGRAVGTVSLEWRASHLQFGEFYLLESHQRAGIGTLVLRGALQRANELNVETKLEHLKWNPVATLYARHGFHRDCENETHWFLIRKPNPPIEQMAQSGIHPLQATAHVQR